MGKRNQEGQHRTGLLPQVADSEGPSSPANRRLVDSLAETAFRAGLLPPDLPGAMPHRANPPASDRRPSKASYGEARPAGAHRPGRRRRYSFRTNPRELHFRRRSPATGRGSQGSPEYLYG